MASVVVRCPQCGSNEVIKRGKTDTGGQRDRCRNNVCAQGSFLLEYRYQGYLPRVKRQIVDIALNGSGIRIQPECWASARTQWSANRKSKLRSNQSMGLFSTAWRTR